MWDVAGPEKFSAKAHESDVWSVIFLDGGRTLASTDGDWRKPGQVKFWDVMTGTLRRTMNASEEVLSIASSSDGRMVAVGCTDGTVKAWNDEQLR
jgi:WD40 repeat protein